jgi:predicted regulator of Ras-like GTPase activity (Roadblock/LC7/MglB family)
MESPQVMFDEEFREIQSICDRLYHDANARVVFVVDKNGQPIASSGETEHIDITTLASLTAGNIAATGGIAGLLKENEFTTQFHEGEKSNIHIQIVAQRVIMVVIFDQRSSLGLVRLRMRKAAEELTDVLQRLLRKAQTPGVSTPLDQITDEDIENLFKE